MRIALLASYSLLAVACTDDKSASPTITDLTFAPMTVTVGAATTVSGTMTFDDDGDLDKLAAEVTLPDQTKQTFPKTALPGVGDMTHGTLGFQMTFIPPAAGIYNFQLWLTDESDNESNRLAGQLTAQ